MWRRKPKLTADSFAHDPLARRVFVRTQPEIIRNERRDAWLRGGSAGGGATGNALAGVAIAFVLMTLWAVVISVFEQIVYEIRRISNARKSRKRKPSGFKVHFPEL